MKKKVLLFAIVFSFVITAMSIGCAEDARLWSYDNGILIFGSFVFSVPENMRTFNEEVTNDERVRFMQDDKKAHLTIGNYETNTKLTKEMFLSPGMITAFYESGVKANPQLHLDYYLTMSSDAASAIIYRYSEPANSGSFITFRVILLDHQKRDSIRLYLTFGLASGDHDTQMKGILADLIDCVLLKSDLDSSAEKWICFECGNLASGKFCNQCGASRRTWDLQEGD